MEKIECNFCEATAEDSDAAAEDGWVPSFIDGEEEILQPVCPLCQDKYCIFDGEMVVKKPTEGLS